MSCFGFGPELTHFRHFSMGSLKKTQFYVWFLGSKESHGLRGREYALPAIRELIDEANRHPPPCKVTVQISGKGMKVIQRIPSISRSGKLKMELMKLLIPPHSITYSSLGPHPYTDIVSCTLLLWNPDTRCPVHIHVYRCDSPETASIMHSALQMLVDRPENQRALMDVERRLMARGLLLMRTYEENMQRGIGGIERLANGRRRPDSSQSIYHQGAVPTRGTVSYPEIAFSNGKRGYSMNSVTDCPAAALSSRVNPLPRRVHCEDRVSRLHQAVFVELKEKLQKKGPILLPPKDYSLRFAKGGIASNLQKGPWPICDARNDPADERRLRTLLPRVSLTGQNHLAHGASSHGSTLESSNTAVGARKLNRHLFAGTARPNTYQLAASKLAPLADSARQCGGYSKLAPNSNGAHCVGRFSKSHPVRNGDNAVSGLNNRLASSTSNIVSAVKNEGRLSCDGNWIFRKPHFSSMQNICNRDYDQNFGQETKHRRDIKRGNWRKGNTSAASSVSFQRRMANGLRQDQANSSLVCDPFGRKYERRTTVSKFWNNIQLPIKIEDNYGMWYLAPSHH